MRSSRVPAFFCALAVGMLAATVSIAGAGGATPAATATPAPSAAPTADSPLLPPAGIPLQAPSVAGALRALHTGQPENAARDFLRIKQAGGIADRAEAQYLLGRAYLAAGKPQFAVLPLRQASREYEALPDYALFNLGEAYLMMDRGASAVQAYERLLVEEPDSVLSPRARLRLADSLAMDRQWERARELYQQVLEAANSGTPQEEILVRIAGVTAQSGSAIDAGNLYFRVWRDFPASDAAKRADSELDALATGGVKVPSRASPEVRWRRAMAMSEAGKNADALAAIDAMISAKIKLPGDWRLYRALLCFKAKDYPQARKEFESLSTSLPAGPERAEAMYWYARALARGNDYVAADKTYDKLRAQYPKLSWSRDALYKQGLMALEDRDFAGATRYFDLYGKTYPTAPDADEAGWYLGWSQYRARKYLSAEATFKLLNERFPRSQLAPRARYWTGRGQIASGRRDLGVETLSSLALEQSLTYYGLLASGVLADAGVDLPMSTTDADAPDVEAVDVADETADVGDTSALPPPADLSDQPLTVAAPPSTYRFHLIRAKALVRLGFQPEAALELAAARVAAPSRVQKLELARLAIAADYYHGAQAIARVAFGAELEKSRGNGEIVRLAYPKAWPRYVVTYAGQYKYSPSVLWAIMREESTYRPEVVSPVGAIGLLQIMPKTGQAIADRLGVKGFTPDRLFDPEINIGFSANYVRDLLARYGGNEALAIASYNAGPEAVDRWVKQRGDLAADEFVEEIPYTETRRYVKRVLMSYGIYEALYGPGAPKIHAGRPLEKSTLCGTTVAAVAPVATPVPAATAPPAATPAAAVSPAPAVTPATTVSGSSGGAASP